MPISFDRFRLLNDPGSPIAPRFRNESTKIVQVKAKEEDPPLPILPGQEIPLPVSDTGETIIEVINEEGEPSS